MRIMMFRLFGLTMACMTMVAPAACVDVQTGPDGKKTVSVAAPFVGVHVKTPINPADTGLPVYPGARLVEKPSADAESANVLLGAPGFGLRVIAAEMESDAAPEALVTFYKREMAKLGTVIECPGEIDMGASSEDTPGCKLRPGRTDLAIGMKKNFRLASVSRRGSGSKVALVNLQIGTHDDS